MAIGAESAAAGFADGGGLLSGLRVLIIDDDDDLRGIVRESLEREGFVVEESADGTDLLALSSSPDIALIVLDLGLPGMSGLDVLRALRRHRDTPVIVLTGRGDVTDRVVGLELGADDYLVKPFAPRELAARIRSVLRRSAGASTKGTLRFGELSIDTASREALLRGQRLALTPREFDLLAFLAASPGRVFSREELLRALWKSTPEWQGMNTVNEHVYRLRTKIEEDPSVPRWIITVRRAGYRFAP
ncbi:MAG TPA: response regulator transcription factor [Acidimicrobiales bacterium]|jgi:DNA-binding response OmpR family regulator|nr:response regulator transcription factor [Acidimicrobiales bacterium]